MGDREKVRGDRAPIAYHLFPSPHHPSPITHHSSPGLYGSSGSSSCPASTCACHPPESMDVWLGRSTRTVCLYSRPLNRTVTRYTPGSTIAPAPPPKPPPPPPPPGTMPQFPPRLRPVTPASPARA